MCLVANVRHEQSKLDGLLANVCERFPLLNARLFKLKAIAIMSALTLPKRQILDSSKLKEFADDSSKYDEIGGNFSKRIENTEGKGEIGHHEQFLLFPQCFQKTYIADK